MEKIFTIKGLKTEWHRIRWVHLKSTPANGEGALKLTEKVLIFAGAFALLFAVYNVLIAAFLRA